MAIHKKITQERHERTGCCGCGKHTDQETGTIFKPVGYNTADHPKPDRQYIRPQNLQPAGYRCTCVKNLCGIGAKIIGSAAVKRVTEENEQTYQPHTGKF